MNLLALDQASRISGYAIFQEGKLIDSGTFEFDDAEIADRLVKIRQKILEFIEQYNINQVIFEDIQLQQTANVQTHKVLAEVFGVVEETCREVGVPAEAVHAAAWRSVLKIKGRQRAEQKRNAQIYVSENYNKKVSQDESDAICIGAYYLANEQCAF